MAYDAIVLGGGFYGCAVAVYLARRRGLRVLLIEAEGALMRRASYHNQARIHSGYHYPRSFVTANRSRRNFPLFVRDWPDAVKRDFTKLYAIARRNSRVTARQFQRFCREIGAPLEPVGPELRALFDRTLVEEVFLAQEYAFDADALAGWAMQELFDAGVETVFGVRASEVCGNGRGPLRVTAASAEGDTRRFSASLVLNCTYSGLRRIAADAAGAPPPLKHEITEMGLVTLPPTLSELGITLMDGPFFSCMPFPPRGVHTLSHVRYTPHVSWLDKPGVDPYQLLAVYPRESRVERMVRDVARYMPAILDARHVDSLFEVKTLLVKNEVDDGRPILFHKDAGLPGYYAILGSKIDNIYDVLERLDYENLDA